MKIAVIGAGASGMAAAISAAESGNAKVTVFERQSRVGKKLSVTGNGRCNLSNINAVSGGFHGKNPSFVNHAISVYPPSETLNWFESMGLFTVTESSGRVYPYSDQANSVIDILRFSLMKSNIELKTDCEVSGIKKNGDKFTVKCNGNTFTFDRVIIACGGIAGTKAGGSLLGYKLLQSLGHHSTKLSPSLVQIKTDWKGVSALKGVRANCKASIYRDNTEIISSSGEIQFTDYGISGPVIFEISRDACQGNGKHKCRLDLTPDLNKDKLNRELSRRRQSPLTTDDLLTGIIHNKLGRVISKEAGIKSGIPISNITDTDINNLCSLIKSFEISLTEPMGMDHAQVTAGGILTEEFDDKTMQSKLASGLFACGEVLDIDGDCGGYNLQWAWSSGRLAGASAAKEQL